MLKHLSQAFCSGLRRSEGSIQYDKYSVRQAVEVTATTPHSVRVGLVEPSPKLQTAPLKHVPLDLSPRRPGQRPRPLPHRDLYDRREALRGVFRRVARVERCCDIEECIWLAMRGDSYSGEPAFDIHFCAREGQSIDEMRPRERDGRDVDDGGMKETKRRGDSSGEVEDDEGKG
jgi:hypothetical protein